MAPFFITVNFYLKHIPIKKDEIIAINFILIKL